MNKYLQTFPIDHAKALVARKFPSWPAASIILLIVFAVIFPPGLLTGMNLYLLLLSLIVWIFSGEKFDPNLLRAIAPFGLIIVFGLVAGIGSDWYIYLKDAWYLSNPAVIVSTGYVLYRCKPDVTCGLRAFVIGGTLVGLFFLSSFATHPDLVFQSSVKIRETIGTGYYAPALSFTILCAYSGKWSEGLALPRRLAFCCLVVCALAVVLCFSRTMMIVVIIGILAAAGILARREWQRIVLVAIFGLLLVSVMRLTVDTESREVQHTFIGKLARSLDEISVQEYTDFKSINENWRGYETARALKLYYSGSPIEWLFGHGFGAKVDLGLAMPLGGTLGEGPELKRFIPILHNGYAYLLVKGGAVAIFLFGNFLFWLYSVGRRVVASEKNQINFAPGRVLQAVVVTLAVTTWIVSGVFNKLDMFPYILVAGFLLAAVTRPQDHRI